MRKRDKFWLWFVGFLPDDLIYWATIRLIAYATGNEKYRTTIVCELSAMEAVDRWSKR